jgi:DtxR family Mn-dependent transcriptional regulator
VKDIAKRLGVKMPTVTSMLKILGQHGFVDYEKYEYLDLTEKGKTAGEGIYHRHHVIRQFLIEVLKVDPNIADEEACKMEHGISSDTLDRLAKFMEFVQSCPRVGSNLFNYFEGFRERSKEPDRCLERMDALSDGSRGQIEAKETDVKEDNGRK